MTASAPTTAQLDEVDRINARDLKAQGEGEMHILHKDYILRWNGMGAVITPEQHAEALEKLALRERSTISGRIKRFVSQLF